MNIQIECNEHEDRAFYSLNFPDNINFKRKDKIWLMDFMHFFQKGNLYYENHGYDISEFDELEETSLVCDITNIQHGFIESVGYILILQVDFWHSPK